MLQFTYLYTHMDSIIITLTVEEWLQDINQGLTSRYVFFWSLTPKSAQILKSLHFTSIPLISIDNFMQLH